MLMDVIVVILCLFCLIIFFELRHKRITKQIKRCTCDQKKKANTDSFTAPVDAKKLEENVSTSNTISKEKKIESPNKKVGRPRKNTRKNIKKNTTKKTNTSSKSTTGSNKKRGRPRKKLTRSQ